MHRGSLQSTITTHWVTQGATIPVTFIDATAAVLKSFRQPYMLEIIPRKNLTYRIPETMMKMWQLILWVFFNRKWNAEDLYIKDIEVMTTVQLR